MTTITRACLRHRRLVVSAWLVLTVVGALTASRTVGRLTHSFATPGTAGYDTNEQLLKTFGIDGNKQPTLAVLTLPPGQSMDTAAGQAIAAKTFAAATGAGHLAVADFADTRDPRLIGPDHRTTWAVFDMPNPDIPSGQGVMEAIEPALRASAPPGASVRVTGFEQIQSVGGSAACGGPGVLVETLIGAVGALAVLLFVYGSAIAIVPLLIAVPAILTAFLLILGLTGLTDVSFLVQYLVAVMGLGIVVDYSLLLVTRRREEREAGRDNEEAIPAAAPTAGRAVVLSGLTVAVGLLSLVLLPGILAAWGPALDRRRLRKGSTIFSRGWERWSALIVRRRWIAGFAGLAIVIGLAVPALSMNTGQPRADSLGVTGQPALTLHSLEATGVPAAVTFPIQVLPHGGPGTANHSDTGDTGGAGERVLKAPASYRSSALQDAHLDDLDDLDSSGRRI